MTIGAWNMVAFIMREELLSCLSLSLTSLRSVTLDTVQDIFMKLGTNVNHHQTMCWEQEPTLHLHFLWNYGPLKFFL